MKRFLVCLVLLGLLVVGIFIFNGNKSKDSKNTKIKVGDAILTSRSHGNL